MPEDEIPGVAHDEALGQWSFVRGATIEIELAPPLRPIVLKQIRLLRYAELCAWLRAMVAPGSMARAAVKTGGL